jgi:hypothetical protein
MTEGTSRYDVEELVPLGVYQARMPFNWRWSVLTGALWGVMMLGFMLWFTPPGSGMLLYLVPVLAAASVYFGIALRRSTVRKIREIQARLHGGDPALVPPQPPGRFDARVLATLVRGHLGISGQLYVGEYEWVFVPHLNNPAANRARIVLGPADEMRVDVVERPPNAFRRMIVDGPYRRVRVACRAGELLFIVPDPPYVAEELLRRVEAARARVARLERG